MYGSQSLKKGENHYPAYKLEFLALKWAVMMVFHEYLFGNKFMVKSDNHSLTCILTIVWLDAMGHHWVAQLVLYDFAVLYKSRKTNIEADSLSWIDWDWELTSEVVRVILNTTMDGCSPLAKICAHTIMVVPNFLAASGIGWLGTEEAMPNMTAADWAEAQMQNWDLNQIFVCTRWGNGIGPSYAISNLGRLNPFYTTSSSWSYGRGCYILKHLLNERIRITWD